MEASPSTAHLFIIKPFTGQGLMRLFSTHPSTEDRIAPPAGNAMNEVRVNRKAADRVASGHPVDLLQRRRPIAMAHSPARPCKVADPRGRSLGTAHYSSASQIALRMLSPQVEEIGREFFLRRLRAAEEHRRTVVHDSDAYRVVHGEADLLPALIVDRYADYLVMQTLDQGMDAAKAEIASCLEEIFHPRGIVARNDVAVRAKEQLPLESVSGRGRDSRNGRRCT